MKTMILSISMIGLMAVSGFSAGTDKDCCKKKDAKCEVKCDDLKKCTPPSKDCKTAEECMAACKKAEAETKTESSAKKSCCKK